MSRRSLLPLALLALVAGASLLPLSAGDTSPALVPWLADAGHLLGYGAVAASLSWSRRVRGWRDALAVALLVAAAGAGVELLQTLVPGRLASVGDALRNLAGAAVGSGLAAVVRRRTDR